MVRNIAYCGEHSGLLPFLDSLHGPDSRPSWTMVSNSTATRAVASSIESSVEGMLSTEDFPPLPSTFDHHDHPDDGNGGGGGGDDDDDAMLRAPRHQWFDSWLEWWRDGRFAAGGPTLPLVLRQPPPLPLDRPDDHHRHATGRVQGDSLPFFFIIGSQKGGTTLLRRLLAQHPRLATHPGEGRFWLWPRLPVVRTAGDMSDYARKFTIHMHLAERRRVQDHTHYLFFDHTPAYLVSPFAPAQLAHAFPRSARYVLQLRRPADRFVSNLRMDLCRSEANDRSALAAELSSLGFGDLMLDGDAKGDGDDALRGYVNSKGPWMADMADACNASAAIHDGSASERQGYPFLQRLWRCRMLTDRYAPLARGLYAAHIATWFRYVAPLRTQRTRSFRIVNAEDFFRDPLRAAHDTVRFLGLEGHAFDASPSLIEAQRHPDPGPGARAAGPWCVARDAANDDDNDPTPPLLSSAAAAAVVTSNSEVVAAAAARQPAGDEVRQVRARFREILAGAGAAGALEAFYGEDSKRLEALLGTDFDWRPWT